MAFVLRAAFDFYNHLFTTLKDPRTDGYYLIEGSPLPMLAILATFAALCRFGPIFMESRKPLELKFLMTLYNFLQVVGNFYFACKAVYFLFWKHKFSFSCQNVDYSNSDHGLAELNLTYIYFLFKLFDLFDTVFIVLKKKNAQLSFLHCYHHFGILAGSYIATKWLPGGPATILGVINTFVHSIMYFYYFMTAFKPELKQSIWWKKYITQIQIIQFAINVVHFLNTILSSECDYPKCVAWAILIQNFFMLALFSDFYRKIYLKKKV